MADTERWPQAVSDALGTLASTLASVQPPGLALLDPIEVSADHVVLGVDQLDASGSIRLQVRAPSGPTLTLSAGRVSWQPQQLELTSIAVDLGELRATATRLVRDAEGRISLDEVVVLRGDLELARAEQVVVVPSSPPTATGVSLHVCPCGTDAGVFRVTAEVVRTGGDGGSGAHVVELEGARVSAGSLSAPWPVGTLAEDGRASGLLLPSVSVDETVGVELAQPIFLRLGRHADLQVALGWATAIGPLGRAWLRYALGDAGRGEVRVDSRVGVGEDHAELSVAGFLGARVAGRLRAAADLDLLSAPALHAARRRDVDGRARRYGRTRAWVGWDGDQLALSGEAALLQTRPAPLVESARRGEDKLEPFPRRIPSVHRLPSVRLGALTWPSSLLRVDLDAGYTHSTRWHGTFVDWGETPQASLLGLAPHDDDAVADPLAGNGVHDESEPLTGTDLVDVGASVAVPLSLQGYGTWTLAAGMGQRYAVARRVDAQRAFARQSHADLATTLTTSLFRRSPTRLHIVRPMLAWRTRALESGEDRLGRPAVTRLADGDAVEHALDVGLAMDWRGDDWLFGLDASQTFMPWAAAEGGCAACGVAGLEARLVADRLALRASASWAWREPGDLLLDAGVEVESEKGARFGARHVHRPDALWWAGRPTLALPAEVWREPGGNGLRGEATDTTTLLLGRRGVHLDGEVWAGVLWDRDLDLEAGISTGYTGACGCWRVGTRLQRHASSPRWEGLLLVEVLADAP